MGIRQIRVNDDPILRKVSRPVESFDAKLFKLLDDMRDTLYDADGCGLAKDSIVLLEQVRTIDKQRLKEKMGCLDMSSMGLVDKALSVSFGLN